jgi:tetratricopeptide (TPR) repeat protein
MTMWRCLLLAMLSWLAFAGTSYWLRDTSRLEASAESLRVRLPLLVQLAYSGGDSYLAANTNVFRSIMVGANVTETETYRVQAQLQVDAANLNPWHEDNYYLAAAMLPWNGQVDAALVVLNRAAQVRQWDMWPAFYYAFNAMYFERDMAKAGQWAETAATRNPRNAPALRAMASAWYERGDDPRVAMEILEKMFEDSRDENFRALLSARYRRLQGLLALREAVADYRSRYGSAPRQIEQLIGHGTLQALPDDPLGVGYVLDADGQAQLADHMTKQKQR